jgi:hypothetical protein
MALAGLGHRIGFYTYSLSIHFRVGCNREPTRLTQKNAGVLTSPDVSCLSHTRGHRHFPTTLSRSFPAITRSILSLPLLFSGDVRLSHCGASEVLATVQHVISKFVTQVVHLPGRDFTFCAGSCVSIFAKIRTPSRRSGLSASGISTRGRGGP